MDINFDNLIEHARDEAKRYHHKYIRTEHLLLALLRDVDLPIDVDRIRLSLSVMQCPTCDAEEQMVLSASAQRAWHLAKDYAGGHPITEQHLLLGILQSSLTVQRLLASYGLDTPALIADIESKIQHGK